MGDSDELPADALQRSRKLDRLADRIAQEIRTGGGGGDRFQRDLCSILGGVDWEPADLGADEYEMVLLGAALVDRLDSPTLER